MRVVIADASPLNCLILIDAVHILPELYGSITLPWEVRTELADQGAPS